MCFIERAIKWASPRFNYIRVEVETKGQVIVTNLEEHNDLCTQKKSNKGKVEFKIQKKWACQLDMAMQGMTG